MYDDDGSIIFPIMYSLVYLCLVQEEEQCCVLGEKAHIFFVFELYVPFLETVYSKVSCLSFNGTLLGEYKNKKMQ